MANKYVRTSALQQSIPIVDNLGRPTPAFVTLINTNTGNVVAAINQLTTIPEIQQALGVLDAKSNQLDQTLQTAQNTISQAQQQTDATKREAALQGSYIEPTAVLTASTTTITIASHTRFYTDGSQVSVNGGTAPASGSGDTDYVSYNDPPRTGGTVSYIVSTVAPVQTGDTHVVGAVTIPATGTQSGGDGPRRPGYVQPQAALQ